MLCSLLILVKPTLKDRELLCSQSAPADNFCKLACGRAGDTKSKTRLQRTACLIMVKPTLKDRGLNARNSPPLAIVKAVVSA